MNKAVFLSLLLSFSLLVGVLGCSPAVNPSSGGGGIEVGNSRHRVPYRSKHGFELAYDSSLALREEQDGKNVTLRKVGEWTLETASRIQVQFQSKVRLSRRDLEKRVEQRHPGERIYPAHFEGAFAYRVFRHTDRARQRIDYIVTDDGRYFIVESTILLAEPYPELFREVLESLRFPPPAPTISGLALGASRIFRGQATWMLIDVLENTLTLDTLVKGALRALDNSRKVALEHVASRDPWNPYRLIWPVAATAGLPEGQYYLEHLQLRSRNGRVSNYHVPVDKRSPLTGFMYFGFEHMEWSHLSVPILTVESSTH